jgi:hypothetical protein
MTIFCVANSVRLPLLAQWNWYGWLSSIPMPSSRGSVITLCIVIICLSLFVLMKKFSSDGGARRV